MARPAKKSLNELMSEALDQQGARAQEGFEVRLPNELANVGMETYNAPTKYPNRPRAFTIAYNSTSRTLYVVFRDNTWYEYRDVPVSYWNGLKGSDSTGEYLANSGLDAWPADKRGPANVDELSEGTKARISYSAQIGSAIKQKGSRLLSYEDVFIPKGE
jgi:hypothetical protein